MGFVDQIFYWVPLLLLIAIFAAAIWADSNNPLQVLGSLPSVLVPDLAVPRLR